MRKLTSALFLMLFFGYNVYAATPTVLYPVDGDQLETQSVKYVFDTGGLLPEYFYLTVGYRPGDSSIFSTGQISDHIVVRSSVNPDRFSLFVSELPLNERLLYFTLNYDEAGVWKRVVTRYRAGNQVPRLKEAPPLLGADGPVVFSWTDNGLDVIDHVFVILRDPFELSFNQYRGRPLGRATSSKPIPISNDGWPFTARLWYKLASNPRKWQYVDRGYTAFD